MTLLRHDLFILTEAQISLDQRHTIPYHSTRHHTRAHITAPHHTMKAGSASYMVARGHDVSVLEPRDEIPMVSKVDVLGWHVSDDASFSTHWSLAKALAWRAFHGNVRSSGWKCLGVRRLLPLLDSSEPDPHALLASFWTHSVFT